MKKRHVKKPNKWLVAPLLIALLVISLLYAFVNQRTAPHSTLASQSVAASNTLAQKPFLGWTSWDTLRSNPTEVSIETQARAMAKNLKSHGYVYVNLDDFWYLNPGTTVDQYGRWFVDHSRFPHGISTLATYVHDLGLKFGLYLTPGIPVAAVGQNTPIQGTNYRYHARDIVDMNRYETNYYFGNRVMYSINYSKPGAQVFVNSWADLLASWGVDFLKLDAVSDSNIPDVQAWSTALHQSGRQIYLDLSSTLDVQNASTWRQSANGWRIDGDIRCRTCSTLATWTAINYRFYDAPKWAQWGGPGGWNDLDALDISNGSKDGLSNDERQTYMTLWAISAAPLYTGDNLTTLDSYGMSLLTNNEVLAVDQAGVIGTPISGNLGVWRAYEADGSYIIALFNLDSTSANETVNWSDIGLTGSAKVRDLWSGQDLGSYTNGFSAQLRGHASRLLKVVPATPNPLPSYEAESPANTLAGGAIIEVCAACHGGSMVSYVGSGGSLQFNDVYASVADSYTLTIYYADGDSARTAYMSVNGEAWSIISFPDTGGWSTPGSLSVTINLNSGTNTIKFFSPLARSPNFDRITLPPQIAND